MVDQNSTPEFYDDIYRKNPDKWSILDRDYTAFKLISRVIQHPRTMLDYGCGNGHTLALFHSQWPRTVYTGVDISTVALQLARERLPAGKYAGVLPPKTYDLITIMGVAEHFESPAEELARISEFLSEDGIMYIEVPNCLSYSDDKSEGFRKTHAGADQIEWHLTRESWENIIKEAGLQFVLRVNGPAPTWEFIWILKRA